MTGRLGLPVDEVHVWFSRLDELVDPHVLTDEERDGARRFHGDPDRTRWLAGRAHLRRVLGSYLGQDPRAISLSDGANGKPELAGGVEIVFNRSTTEDVGAVAVARGGSLGIDIESTTVSVPAQELAGWLFTPTEADWVAQGLPRRRKDRFLRLWTVKEAMAKAHGEGVGIGFASFEVEPESLTVASAPSGSSPTDWQLAAVTGPPGVVGAVARLYGEPTSRVRVFA